MTKRTPAPRITACIMLSAASSSLSWQPCADVLFPEVRSEAGLRSNHLWLGDLNGDGHADALSRHSSFAELSVLFGRGNGIFDLAATHGRAGATSLVVGDLEGDGDMDALFTGPDGFEWLVNDGTGGLSAGPAGDLLAEPYGALLQDLNGDGAADLVVIQRLAPSDLVVYLNDGSGSFGEASSIGLGLWQVAVAAADIDGDDDADLVVFDQGEAVAHIITNDGAGTLTLESQQPLSDRPAGFVLCDFDHDGHMDLIVGHWTSHTLDLYRGNGAGGFAVAQTLESFAGLPRPMATDLDQDGAMDLIVSDSSSGILTTVLYGDGSGGIESRLQILHSGAATVRAAHDINADGYPEIITMDELAGGRDLAVVRNVDGRSFHIRTNRSIADELPENVRLGHLNGDGILDAVVLFSTNPSSHVQTFFGDGHGAFTGGQTYFYGSAGHSMEIDDLTGDGLADVVIANDIDDFLVVLTNTGSGTLVLSDIVPIAQNAGELALADLDGDGDIDAAVVSKQFPRLDVALNNGAGNLSALPRKTLRWQSSDIQLGDLDGDGTTDLAILPSGQAFLHILLGDGAGGFGPEIQSPLVPFLESFVLGDVDSDGALDAIVSVRQGIAIMRGLGDGTFAPPTTFDLDTHLTPHALRLADANRDGHLDVLFALETVVFLPGDGAGGLGEPVRFGSTDTPLDIEIGDLDGDGRLDITLVNPIMSAGLEVLLNRCHDAQVCPADLDLDGVLTIFDFLQFQNLFDAGDPRADFDADGSLTLFDFLAFQNEFDAGC